MKKNWVRYRLFFLVVILTNLLGQAFGEQPNPWREAGFAITRELEEMVTYLQERIAEGDEGRGPKVCDTAVRKLNRILQDLRLLRKAVPSFHQGPVDEISRKITKARFLIIADCCSQAGLESLLAALDDLGRLIPLM
jgi:hypothetical protein